MNRAAHREDPHRIPPFERLGEVMGVEAVDAGGEGQVRRKVVLRLEPEKVLDHGERRHRRTRDQVLAEQQRAIQVAEAEHPATVRRPGFRGQECRDTPTRQPLI